MMGKSELKHLSLYDNDLEGQDAITEIKELLTMLRKLEFIDIESNLLFMLDVIALKALVKKTINFDGRAKSLFVKA